MNAYNEITDLAAYTARMGKGLMDKLFFVDKIETDTIVDFGCADGLLLQNLERWFPAADLIGFDNDERMIEKARELNAGRPIRFFSDWDAIIKTLKRQQAAGCRTTLVLSSIVHEIYHYQEPHEVDEFWKKVFGSGFDFIVFRDMIPARSIDRPADTNDVAKVYRKFLHRKELQDFGTIWGSVENNRNLVHFLLKYDYTTPNWEREVKENYLPIYREDLLAMIPFNYDVMYHEHYVLPYIKRKVRDDLGIELKDPTHLKFILEKKPNGTVVDISHG